MRNKISYLTALIALSAASTVLAGGPDVIIPVEPNYFNGFFIGGTGALHHAAFKENSSFAVTNDILFTGITLPAGVTQTANADGDSFEGYYGAQGGVGAVFNHRWYFGIMGFGEWGSQSDTAVVNTNTPINNIGAGVTVTGNLNTISQTTTKIENDYGAAFKPGILVTPKTMIYGKIGVIWADISLDNTTTGVVNAAVSTTANPPTSINTSLSSVADKENNSKTALLLGIGIEQFIYKDIITFNVEYNYANFGTINAGPASVSETTSVNAGTATQNNIEAVTTSANTKVQVDTLLAGLNFYFGSTWL